MSELWILKEANLFESPIFFLFHIEMLFFNLDKDQCLKGEKNCLG